MSRVSGLSWEAHTTEDGKTYYHNRDTGESSWRCPADDVRPAQARTIWAAVWSEEYQRQYFYNHVTGETKWENPDSAPSEEAGDETSASLTIPEIQPANERTSYSMAADKHAQFTQMASEQQEHRVDISANNFLADHRAVTAAHSSPLIEVPTRRPRTVTASPPKHRENEALRQALNRKRESFSRLEAARAAAKARIAKVRADAEARSLARSAKLAARVAGAVETDRNASVDLDAEDRHNPEEIEVSLRRSSAHLSEGEIAVSPPPPPPPSRDTGHDESKSAVVLGDSEEKEHSRLPVRDKTRASHGNCDDSQSTSPSRDAVDTFASASAPLASASSPPARPPARALPCRPLSGTDSLDECVIASSTEGVQLEQRSMVSRDEGNNHNAAATSDVGYVVNYDEEVRMAWEAAAICGSEADNEAQVSPLNSIIVCLLAPTLSSRMTRQLSHLLAGKAGTRHSHVGSRSQENDGVSVSACTTMDFSWQRGQEQGEDGVLVESGQKDSLEAAADGAASRCTRLMELLSSRGDTEACAEKVAADDHLVCRRLVDFAFAGAALVLPAGEVEASAGMSRNEIDMQASALERLGYRLCHASFVCLSLCGSLSPEMWADLSSPPGGKMLGAAALHDGRASGACGARHEAEVETYLSRLLALCVSLSRVRSEPFRDRTGFDERVYFYGRGDTDEGAEDGDEGGSLGRMALALIYEAVNGCCRSGGKERVERLRDWKGLDNLVVSLMDTVVNGREESYIMATKALLAANHLFARSSPSSSSPEVDAARATLLPTLCSHAAKHDIQAAVLHILNEEGYPNGDSQLARLCVRFCADAFAEKDSSEALFYVNDVKVMIDVIVRELLNLPVADSSREDYEFLLHRLLERSEWATRGGRYREADIERVSTAVSDRA